MARTSRYLCGLLYVDGRLGVLEYRPEVLPASPPGFATGRVGGDSCPIKALVRFDRRESRQPTYHRVGRFYKQA